MSFNQLRINADDVVVDFFQLFVNQCPVHHYSCMIGLPVLDGVTLNLFSCAKYLGTILDQRFNWKENIEEHLTKGLMVVY